MAADSLLTAIRTHLNLPPTHQVIVEPIKKGASGRQIMRLCPKGHPNYIGIHYTLERSDNANFLPVAHFLADLGINVPEVIYDNVSRQIAIVEDLGTQDLLSLKDDSFEQRLPLYRSAFEQLNQLYYARVPKDLLLQPAFDQSLYQWEQDYFFDHYVETHLKKNSQSFRTAPALLSLSQRLGGSHPHLVHRDFQSQNIMIKDGRSYLIDFQGMRKGLQEYDLASLIYDPYLNHTPQEQSQLLSLWEDVSGEDPIPQILADCACQRLMQALGAYANLYHNQGKEWYEPFLHTGKELLLQVSTDTPQEQIIHAALS